MTFLTRLRPEFTPEKNKCPHFFHPNLICGTIHDFKTQERTLTHLEFMGQVWRARENSVTELTHKQAANWRDYYEMCKPRVVMLMILTSMV
ncbi:MAG: hypothetical protein KKD00_09705, partial [Gammaproteobacteria bacterium]|nr:hypothetical protein [Gammaproteobacteria bacterium]